MDTSLLIHRTETLAVEAFKRPKDIHGLKRNLVAFSGTPRKHPDDPFRIVLIVDPVSTNTFYYEFKMEDIVFVEEMPNVVNIEEEVIPMVRIWIKKRSLGLRCTPFIVDDVL